MCLDPREAEMEWTIAQKTSGFRLASSTGPFALCARSCTAASESAARQSGQTATFAMDAFDALSVSEWSLGSLWTSD